MTPRSNGSTRIETQGGRRDDDGLSARLPIEEPSSMLPCRFPGTPCAIAAVAMVATIFGCHRGPVNQPIECPPGTARMGAPPPQGEEVWCQKMLDGKPVKDGPFVAYGNGADRLIQGSYRDGVQEGEWTTWYENGQRSAVDHYRNGVQDGPHTSWYANGVKALEGSYRTGKREGVWTRWDPTGLTSRQEFYRDDRQVETKP
jgi:hypothetical protein